jgi:hypothetical protein
VTLAERLVALHAALAGARIPHAFGGAIALAYWTLEPRGTRDLDVNVFLPAEDAPRVLDALPFDVIAPDAAAAIARDGQARVWWDDTPVDLFFDYAPVHEMAARHARDVAFEGTTIPVLGPVELAIFKAMFDRTRDWADIEAMLAAGTVSRDDIVGGLRSMLGDEDPRWARLDAAVAASRG